MKTLNQISQTLAPNAPLSRTDTRKLFQWITLVFAYAWWAVIIVFYGLLEQSVSVGYQFHSLPIVVVSLALVQILKLSMTENKRLLSTLAVMGLFISGLLA